MLAIVAAESLSNSRATYRDPHGLRAARDADRPVRGRTELIVTPVVQALVTPGAGIGPDDIGGRRIR